MSEIEIPTVNGKPLDEVIKELKIQHNIVGRDKELVQSIKKGIIFFNET